MLRLENPWACLGQSDETMEAEFSQRGCCYFGQGLNWERMRGGGSDEGMAVRGWKKVREWSELMAGPRWKTFIRSFGRNRVAGAGQGRFGYDPFSYALNFDEGPGRESEEGAGLRNFSVRYAATPVSGKASVDLGREAPAVG